MKLNTRQENLLQAVVLEHIKSAEPIGSALLSDKYLKDLSSATVRSEMLELSEMGYLSQPHISAGRLPTEQAYKYYVNHFLIKMEIKKNIQPAISLALGRILKECQRQDKADVLAARQLIKNLAKKLSEISLETIMVAFAPNDFYYTGVSNLFAKPEFQNQDLIYNLSAMLDNLDQGLEAVFYQVDKDVKILIGSDNPFCRDCSSLLAKFNFNNEVLLGILGPIRMDYETNLALLEFVKEQLI